ncbi:MULTISPECIES: helix-turn-helix domain-containing protein [Acidithiobacillus]|nr:MULTISPECIES: helix-turn-helix domain-containing protein [Acidithiobacillus]
MLSERTAAAVLQVKPSTLQNWRCTRRYDLRYFKTGRLVRYRVADLAEWLAKRQIGGR